MKIQKNTDMRNMCAAMMRVAMSTGARYHIGVVDGMLLAMRISGQVSLQTVIRIENNLRMCADSK